MLSLSSCSVFNNLFEKDDPLNEIVTPVSKNYDMGFSKKSLATYSKNPIDGSYSEDIPTDQRDYALEKEEDYEITYEKVNGTSSYTDICSMGVLDSILYPGSIVDIKDDAYSPINIDLAPLTISANLESTIGSQTGLLYTTIEKPTLGTVRQGIKDLINSNVTDTKMLPSTLEYEIKEIEDQNEFDLNLGFGLKYKKLAISENFNYRKINKQTNIAIVFKQKYLTIDIDHKGITSLLENSVTNRIMNEKFSGKIPAYVASVTYGRIVVMTIQTNYSKEEITNILSASWGNDGQPTYNKALSISFENEIKNIAQDKETKIHYFEYGGGSGTGGIVKTIDSFYDPNSSNSLGSILSPNFELSEKNLGLPISYTIMDASGAPAKLQDSKEYFIKHVEYKPKRIMNWGWLDKLINDGTLLNSDILKIDLSAMIDYSKGENGNDTVAERNIVIPSNVKELHIIGPSLSREYHFTNLSFTIGARSTEIDIYMDSIIFSANENSKTGDGIALKAERETPVNLYIENKVIISSMNGSPAISVPNLRIEGDGILEVYGSSGISKSNAAILCRKSLEVDINGSFNVFGSEGDTFKNINGGNAIEGEIVSLKAKEKSVIVGGNGDKGIDNTNNGIDGGNGGNGGHAIYCSELKIYSNTFEISGGNGGDGGIGGAGKTAKLGWAEDSESGSASEIGYNGGNGGMNGLPFYTKTNFDSLKSLVGKPLFVIGIPGNGGKGGQGGSGGSEYWNTYVLYTHWVKYLNGSNGGQGGQGGNLMIYKDEIILLDSIMISTDDCHPGEGGRGGQGGNYGTLSSWGNILGVGRSYLYGKSGNQGNQGQNGTIIEI